MPMDVCRHRSIIVGLSGRTGRCLWTHPVEPDFVESKREDEVKPAAVVRGRRSSSGCIRDEDTVAGARPGDGPRASGATGAWLHAGAAGSFTPTLMGTENLRS